VLGVLAVLLVAVGILAASFIKKGGEEVKPKIALNKSSIMLKVGGKSY
jgi:hypothetical protein